MTTTHAHACAAVLFDMDGVLIDSEPLWRRAEQEVFADLGVTLTDADCMLTKGLRIGEVIAYWHQVRPWAGSTTRDEVRTRVLTSVTALITREGKELPGVSESIRQCEQRGWKTAIATSSPAQVVDAVLHALGLDGHFDAICSAQDELHGKPHPAVFLRAAERLGVEPTQCLVIEDSIVGMVAAKAARMACVAVPESVEYERPEWGLANAKLRSLEEFGGALSGLYPAS